LGTSSISNELEISKTFASFLTGDMSFKGALLASCYYLIGEKGSRISELAFGIFRSLFGFDFIGDIPDLERFCQESSSLL
jgi:hypothetical protein